MNGMKGWRTIAVNAAIIAGTGALTALAGVDWTQYVSPTIAVLIVSGINMGLRFVTSTPVWQGSNNQPVR